MTTSIFKAYDVRGLCPEELDEAAVFAIGQAFGRRLSGTHVVVGRDARLDSPGPASAFGEGLLAAGLRVTGIGLCTTPMLNFAVSTPDAATDAMVTASHNPAECKGFTFVREHAIPVGSGSGHEEIRAAAMANDAACPKERRRPLERRSILDEYVEFIADRFPAMQPPPVVIDATNVAAGVVLPALPGRLGIQHSALYFEPDGHFPHHEADPLKDARRLPSREGDPRPVTDRKPPACRGVRFTSRVSLEPSGQRGPTPPVQIKVKYIHPADARLAK